MTLPMPTGWFAVATSAEVRPDTVLTRRLGAAERVLFRDGSGQITIADPHCPHLGAHLGRGGVIDRGALRCPFHGLRFDADGRCVSTPLGTRPPRRARLALHPAIESGGWVFSWLGPDRAPRWSPPVLPADPTLRTVTREVASHPQETTENSVDLAHFAVVHGYEHVQLHAFTQDGPYLHARYSFVRPNGLPFLGRRLPVDISVHVWGLGFSFVEVDLPTIGMRTRQFVLPTPVAADRIALRLGMTFGRTPRAPLRWVPRWLFEGPIAALAMGQFVRDVWRDHEIWEHKAHLPRPALLLEDGPIGEYRSWVRQFYPSDTP